MVSGGWYLSVYYCCICLFIMVIVPKLCPGICLFIIFRYQKKYHPSLSRQKIDFWVVHLDVPGGWYPQTISKYFFNYLLMQKKIPVAP